MKLLQERSGGTGHGFAHPLAYGGARGLGFREDTNTITHILTLVILIISLLSKPHDPLSSLMLSGCLGLGSTMPG